MLVKCHDETGKKGPNPSVCCMDVVFCLTSSEKAADKCRSKSSACSSSVRREQGDYKPDTTSTLKYLACWHSLQSCTEKFIEMQLKQRYKTLQGQVIEIFFSRFYCELRNRNVLSVFYLLGMDRL